MESLLISLLIMMLLSIVQPIPAMGRSPAFQVHSTQSPHWTKIFHEYALIHEFDATKRPEQVPGFGSYGYVLLTGQLITAPDVPFYALFQVSVPESAPGQKREHPAIRYR